MLSLREWTAAAACFVVLMIGAEVMADTATATASNVQSQGSVGTQNVATQATAQQQQGQYQGQSASSGVSNSGNSAVKFNNSFNGAAPIRYLPVPAALPIENYQPAIFGRADYADKGPDFVSMRQLVHAMNLVDLAVEVEGAKQIRITAQMMRTLKTPKKDKSAKPAKPKKVMFEINDGEAVNNGFVPIATLTVETKKPDKSNSASLAIAIGKEAQRLGATNVVFLTEGSSKQLQSSGWGIGFSYNYAQVNSDPSGNGSVGSGGFGYSQGKAGYRNLIYLTAIVGVRKDG